MRKLFSIIFKLIAGFFIYTSCVLSFVNKPELVIKLLMLLFFIVPAAIALIVGLKLSHFKNWKRDIGVVFLSASGVSFFVVFTMAFLFMDDMFIRLVGAEKISLFSDYATGTIMITSSALLGWVLVKSNKVDEDIKKVNNSDY